MTDSTITLCAPGERYEILEDKTGLSDGYFSEEHQTPADVALYAAADTRNNPDNPKRLPSYFLYEAKNNLTFYLGPGRVRIHKNNQCYTGPRVLNTLVLEHKDDRKHRPRQSHTLDFGFLDIEKEDYKQSDLEFFSDQANLAALQPGDIDGPPTKGEKAMLLSALRFYFGPANNLKAVAKDKPDLDELNRVLRERYIRLETQTTLGPNLFGPGTSRAPDRVKLFVAHDKLDNPERLPSYFLYEAKNNLMFYIGPDFFHGRPDKGG